MTKKDKRSRKTVRAIQDTLLRLLCTKRLREIRIVDLCTEADINRTTFYLHFCGLGDVLGSLIGFVVLYTALLIVEFWLMVRFAKLGPSSLGTGRYFFERKA